MTPKLEETIYLDFIVSSATGAAADADSTPTAAVYEDATDVAILAPTVVKRTSLTGNYRVPVACTAANGFEADKSYNVIVSATIGGIAAKAKVGSFQVRAEKIGGAVASVTGNVGGNVQGNVVGSVASVVGLNTSLIDAAISTRSTYAGGDTSGTTTLLAQIGTAGAGLTAIGDTRLAYLDAPVSASGATVAAIETRIFDTALVETGLTFRKAMRACTAAAAGKLIEPVDRSSTTIAAAANDATTRITSTNSNDGATLTRTVSLSLT